MCCKDCNNCDATILPVKNCRNCGSALLHKDGKCMQCGARNYGLYNEASNPNKYQQIFP